MHFLSQFPHSPPSRRKTPFPSFFIDFFIFKKIEDKGPSRMPEFQRIKKARWPGLVSESSSQQTQPRRKKSLSNPPSKTRQNRFFMHSRRRSARGRNEPKAFSPPLIPPWGRGQRNKNQGGATKEYKTPPLSSPRVKDCRPSPVKKSVASHPRVYYCISEKIFSGKRGVCV